MPKVSEVDLPKISIPMGTTSQRNILSLSAPRKCVTARATKLFEMPGAGSAGAASWGMLSFRNGSGGAVRVDDSLMANGSGKGRGAGEETRRRGEGNITVPGASARRFTGSTEGVPA